MLPRRDLDRWARWLIHERDGPHVDGQRGLNQRFLEEVRDRVVDRARLQPGDRILDLGAGTGLLAHHACQYMEDRAAVVALDLSADALSECRDSAPDAHALRLHVIKGRAQQLPFRESAFDAIIGRSVLMYIDDKQRAFDEMYRILRPGGRLSVFEPINGATDLYGGREEIPLELADSHAAVKAKFIELTENWKPMMDFDERGLVAMVLAAGFRTIGLQYELLMFPFELTAGDARLGMSTRGNPIGPTWEEAAIAALGSKGPEYLKALSKSRAASPASAFSAVAYLTGVRDSQL